MTCTSDKKTVTEDNKFQHKWLNDQYITCFEVTGIWSLCYIETKCMFCAIGRLHSVAQPTNHSKSWDTEAIPVQSL